MQEHWIRWHSLTELAEKYYFESVLYIKKDFIILMSERNNRKNMVKITFKKSVRSYKYTDETYTLYHTIMKNELYGSSFYGDWTFFKVYNSDYLEWIKDQSKNSLSGLTHFSLITPLSVLDIIATSEPIVELIKV